MSNNKNEYTIRFWQRVPEERKLFLQDILNDDAGRDVFSDKYFDAVARRLEKINSGNRKMVMLLGLIALVLVAGLLHKDVSINTLGLTIGSELVRDVLFLIYTTISLMSAISTCNAHLLTDILRSRFRKLNKEQEDIYMAQFDADIFSLDGMHLRDRKHNTSVVTFAAFYGILFILTSMLVGFAVFLGVIVALNFGVIAFTTYRLFSEPVSPAWVSYTVAVYGIFTLVIEVGLIGLHYVPLPFEDIWPLMRLRRLNERYPGKQAENSRRVKAEIAASNSNKH